MAVLLSRLSLPLTNGVDLRFFHFLRSLSDRYDFTYYGPTLPSNDRSIDAMFRRQMLLPDARLDADDQRGFSARFDSRALYRECPEWRRFLMDELPGHDLVLTTTGWLPHLEGLRSVPILVDVIDDAVLQYLREFRIARGPRAALRKLYYAYLHLRYERRFCSDRVVSGAYITSEVDASILDRVASLSDLRVIQNGVDVEFFAPRQGSERDMEIVFEGNMSFNQNVMAAAHFCRRILPKLQQHIPELRLTIVGKNPDPEVQALGRLRGVEVTGTVDDVRPYIARASVFVCPLLSGGGIKNKILQAWAMGKACVATSVSLGGLGAVDGEDLLIADGDAQFAAAVLRCLSDTALRRSLGERGRDKVVRHYSWESRARALAEQMDSVMAGRIARTPAVATVS